MRRTIWPAVVAFAAAAFLIGCGDIDNPPAGAPVADDEGTTILTTTTADTTGGAPTSGE